MKETPRVSNRVGTEVVAASILSTVDPQKHMHRRPKRRTQGRQLAALIGSSRSHRRMRSNWSSMPPEPQHSEPSISSPYKPQSRRSFEVGTQTQVRHMDHVYSVFIGGHQPIDSTTPLAVVGPFSSRRRHQWTKLQDKKLVEILLHNLHTCTIEVNKIKDVVYQVIAQGLSSVFAVSITPQNVRHRVQSLRKKYEMYRIIINKTRMGWIHDENRFDGPPEVWSALIQQNKCFKSLQKPQHLSYDDLHELFGGNRATGAYMGTFEVPTQGQAVEEQDVGSEDGISGDTLPSQNPEIGSPDQSNRGRSSGTPMGDSSGNTSRPRAQSSVRRRPQSQASRLRTEIEDVLAQPMVITNKKEWTQDYCSVFSILRSMSISGRLLGQAMCYFDRHPHAAMQFVRADEEGRRDYLDYIFASS